MNVMGEKVKVDKGFEINYYKLTYRRKFIRTLWLFPLLLVSLKTYLNCFKDVNSEFILYFFCYGVSLVVLLCYVFQLIYNYRKSKEKDNE